MRVPHQGAYTGGARDAEAVTTAATLAMNRSAAVIDCKSKNGSNKVGELFFELECKQNFQIRIKHNNYEADYHKYRVGTQRTA